ncbi:MAG: CHAT domain-containing protein [Gemmatimonadaceae bacterium]|nr:CHAT domain-containing protein [Gemmatimonadaceae bacterium]
MRTTDALQRVTAASEPWIVVERSARGRDGKAVVYRYAHRRQAALEMLGDEFLGPDSTVHEAFNLRETKASPTVVNAPAPAPMSLATGESLAVLRGSFGSRYRSVVIDAGKRIRVVPATDDVRLADATGGPASGSGPALMPADPSGATSGATAPSHPTQRGTRRGPRRDRETASRVPPSVPGGTAPTTPPPSAAGTARPKRAPADVDLHVRAATDDEYVIDRTHVVAVTIAREALAALATGVQRSGVAKVKAATALIVECLPMQRTSLVNDADGRVEIPVPTAGNPAELRFDVMAREVGAALIKVQVRQGPIPLVTLSLDVAVVSARSGARREVAGQADVASVPALPAAINELRIVQLSPTSHSSQYRFELHLPTKRVRREFVTTELTSDAESYVSSVYRRIEDRWAEHGSEQAAFARDLRAIGSDLFDQLLPLELRQLLWTHRDVIESVQVVSSEPFIPWELVFLRDPAQKKPPRDAAFLGELGVVRWLMDDYPPDTLTISRRKARFVIPEYPAGHELPEAQLERDVVTSRYKATEVTSEAEAIYELLSEPGQFDLLHIACHGVADANDIGSAHLEMPGKVRSDGSLSEEDLLADTVRREADLHDEANGRQPIVVLNACQSARAGYGLKGIGGFAAAFVTGGAGVFIGSSWSVGDVPARTFIEEFYDRFLPTKGRGVTLAKAVAMARARARADGDATWLAYAVYGHPRAVATLVP